MTSAPRWNKCLSKHASLLTKIKNKNTWFFVLLCMCVCNILYNGPDFYTGPLLSN
jgi:hypothetical protein